MCVVGSWRNRVKADHRGPPVVGYRFVWGADATIPALSVWRAERFAGARVVCRGPRTAHT